MRLFSKCLMLFVASALNSLASLAQSDSSLTCTSCMCSEDLTPSGVMISHVHEKNQWMISYRYMDMKMGNMIDGTRSLSDNDVFQNYLMTSNNMRMDMHMLMGMYGLTSRLTLMGMVNFNYNHMNMSMLPTATMHHMGMSGGNSSSSVSSFGLSDIKLHALYGLINTSKHHLLFSAGVSIPTGDILVKGGVNTMYNGVHLPYSMQLGTGTVDIYNTVNYLYYNNNISFSSQVSSIVRPGQNSLNYRYGNEYLVNNWFAWQWARSFSSSLRVEAMTAGSIKGVDKSLYTGYEPTANPANYGGQKITSYIGTNIFLKGAFNGQRIGMEAGLPLYQYLNGPQMKSTYTFIASWSIVF